MSSRKSTSYGYGRDYQLKQAEKYRNRRNNHWKFRIELAKRLVEEHALPRHQGKSPGDIILVDVGCSIGTFAIEFAKIGFRSHGIDFNSTALEIAHQLAQEEKVSPEFVCGDVTNWKVTFPDIDVAVCFDIFEHLHDDELGSLLSSIKGQLSREGSLVFHTYPTHYNYIFFRRGYLRWPLVLFVPLPSSAFNRVVKAYASFLDIVRVLTTGKTYKESIKKRRHCNPTTTERLTDMLHRAGYDIVVIKSSNLYQSKHMLQKVFSRHPITHRNVYGVAVPRE